LGKAVLTQDSQQGKQSRDSGGDVPLFVLASQESDLEKDFQSPEKSLD
jgi:hypothetical protein